MTPTPDPYREWDAAYVLGALGPSDRRTYERHLAGCDTCREAVSELAGMPALLRAVPPDHAATLGGDPEPARLPLADLAHAVRRTRARRRSLAAVAAAALVVAGAAGGLALDLGTPEGRTPTAHVSVAPTPDGTTVELAPVGASEVRATLTATSMAWGTLLEWSCTYPPEAAEAAPPDAERPDDATGYGDGAAEPAVYELVLVDREGERTVVATWTASGGESEGLGASAALPLSVVDRIEIAVAGSEEPVASAPL
jgi:hypothetical protein